MGQAVPFIISSIVSTAVSVIISSSLARDADQKDVGADITKAGVQSSRNRVFGRCRASCTNVYSNVLDESKDVRLDVFAIGGIGKLKYIHQAWIDDKRVLRLNQNINTDPNTADEGLFSGNDLTERLGKQSIEIQFRNGSDIERALELAIDNSDGEWTAAHRGDKVPQVAVKANRVIDQDGVVIVGNDYNIVVEVTGGDCYDPRTDSMTSSRNPVLALLEVLRDNYYGMGVPDSYIDLDSFKAAANWTDSESLYIDGEINCNQSYNDILTNILSCFGGALIIENGLIKVTYEDVASTIYSINEDDYLKSSFSVTEQSSSGYYNVITVDYKSYVNDEAEDRYQIPANILTDTTIQADGFTKSKSIKMPLTIDARTVDSGGNAVISGAVKSLANVALAKAKFQKQIQLDLDLIEFPLLTINSVIAVSNEAHGFSNETFRVTNIKNSVSDEKLSVATITLDRYDDSIYSGNKDGVGGSPQPKPPATVLSPTNLQFNQQTFVTSGYGELTWNTRHYSQNNVYHVDYRLTNGSNPWERAGEVTRTSFKFQNLKSATYDFRVRVLDNLGGGTSDWSTLNDVDIDPDVTLPQVTNVAIDATQRNFVITWDDMTTKTIPGNANNPDSGGDGGTVGDRFAYYEVDILHGGTGNPVTETVYPVDNKYTYTYEDNIANGVNRTIGVQIRIVAKTGQKSLPGTAQAKNNQIDSSGTVITVSGSLSTVLLEWAKRNETDFAGTEVHYSESANFTPTSATLVADTTSNSFTYVVPSSAPNRVYFRVGHYDTMGKSEINYSVEASATPSPIDDLLPNIGQDLDELRNPANDVSGGSGRATMTVASPNKETTVGWGMFADDAGRSDYIIAADRVLVSAGGHPQWLNSVSYSVNDQVSFWHEGGDVTQLYECVQANTGQTPYNNTTYWRLLDDNIDKPAFAIQPDPNVPGKQKLYIENAVISDLTSDNILAGSLTGAELNATARLKVGSGNQTTVLTGEQPGGTNYTFWSGGETYTTSTIRMISSGVMLFGDYADPTVDLAYIDARRGSPTRICIGERTLDHTQHPIELSSEGTMRVGNTTGSGVYLDGNSTNDYAFWAGGTNAASAPVSIKKNGDFYAQNGRFEGEVLADSIVGDVVSAITKTVTEQTRNSVGISPVAVSFTITNARSYERYMVIGGPVISASITSTSGSITIAGNIRVDGDYGVQNTTEASASANGSFGSADRDSSMTTMSNISVVIPANTTGTVNLRLQCTNGSASGTLRLTGVSSSSPTATALLFKPGSDLS